MDQLEKKNIINRNSLSQSYYFEALFREACGKGLFTDTQMKRIQLEFIELMSKETERYTNGESSSVPVETAQSILKSITFSIGAYLKSMPDVDSQIEILKTESISVLFYKGMDIVAVLMDKSNTILHHLQENILKVNNYAYQDTLSTGLPQFFHAYDIEYGASEIPASFDYPLIDIIADLLGVEYIYEYLSRLKIENDFVKYFSEDKVEMLLQSFEEESEHMLINIFELVLTNALGGQLLEQKIEELSISQDDLEWLQKNFEKYKQDKIEIKLEDALNNLLLKLELEPEIIEYCKQVIPKLANRFMYNLHTNTLDKFFIHLKSSSQNKEVFIDGTPMEDELLREFIDELNDIDKISEKVLKIQEKVRSISDLTELLEECFYGNEFYEVFNLLDQTEILLLKNIILNEAGPESMDDYMPEKEWQRILLQL